MGGKTMSILLQRRKFLMGKVVKEYFPFEDPVVEQIVANWVGDGIGTTIQEIQRANNLSVDTFRGNTLVETFDEFENFISLLSLPAGSSSSVVGAFGGCTALTSINLPVNLTTIGAYSFYGCTALEDITIPVSVTSIGIWAFSGCTGLKNLEIPCGIDLRVLKSCGSYGGDLIIHGNASLNNSESWVNLYFNNVTIYGDVNLTKTFTGSASVLGGNSVYRISGFLKIPASYNAAYSFGGYPPFVEIMGDVPNVGQRNGMFNRSGTTLLHLGYNGKVGANSGKSGVDRSLKTYVGEGVSKSADEAVLAEYLADSDMARYSSRLYTWWEYNGQYKSYRVTENLTNCTNSNAVTFPYIIRNSSYETVIVPDDGYVLSSVQVLMYDAQDDGLTPDNPTDITSTAYDSLTGSVYIEHVKGNITINATAV